MNQVVKQTVSALEVIPYIRQQRKTDLSDSQLQRAFDEWIDGQVESKESFNSWDVDRFIRVFFRR